MNYSFTEGAKHDIEQAIAFYEAQAPQTVAARFVIELDRVVQLLRTYPGFGTSTAGDRRTYPLKNFPYSVVYRASSQHLRILVVHHQHRNIQHGSGRH